MLLNVDGSIQDAGWRILADGWGLSIGRGGNPHDGAYTYRRVVDCVTGACSSSRRRHLKSLAASINCTRRPSTRNLISRFALVL